MRLSEDFLLPAPGEWLKLDEALWEWSRCSSSKVRSKGPLMAEPELPSGGLFSMGVCSAWKCEEDLSVGFVINPRKAFPS
ncbi:hypothetical protein OIU76_014189 [Salix suchowensis]|nr:hypothetical protein OIU76_014189 [Salix suchowensis]